MEFHHPNVIGLEAFTDNYIWLIVQGDQAVVVDPGDASVVLKALRARNLTLRAVLLTHHHPDHVGGVKTLKQQTAATVYGPGNEGISDIDVVVAEPMRVQVPGLSWSFEVIDVPGHTRGHIAYWSAPVLSEPPVLFCGDTLFASGCGRLFEGTPEQMQQSLRKLASLPDATLVYCAHEYTTANLIFATAVMPNDERIRQRLAWVEQARARGQPTVPSQIGLERSTNPYLLAQTTDQFARIRKAKDGFAPGVRLDPALFHP